MKFRRLLGLIGVLFIQVSLASDQQREWDYTLSLQNNLSMGQGIWLKSAQQSFWAIFTEAERADNSQAALILHDAGDHPDQKPLIHGLRTVLPQHHWSTLAIQLPVREMGAGQEDYWGLFAEAHQRIQVASEYLRQQGAKHIAVVGYGMGAAMAVYSLHQDPNALSALVTIGLPLPDSALPQAQIATFIKNIALPFLDVYAEFDLPEVTETARQRRLLTKQNPVFRQVKINGETHAYLNDPNMLIKRIYSWLTSSLQN